MRTPSGHIKGDLDVDAWGRQKAIIDKSLFHGMFTYNVPVAKWYEKINDVEQTTFTKCSSNNGALEVIPGDTADDSTYLRSFANPRYEPNRGVLYSTAMWFDNPSATMIRRFGTFTSESGVFFELENGNLYCVVRTTIDTVTSDDRHLVNPNLIAQRNIDLSKGNIFDIQYQWRGVGNYVFFINHEEMVNTGYLGELTRLSMFNPALPIAFESINKGDTDKMSFGCVDVTTEGGTGNGSTYGSLAVPTATGDLSLSGLDAPVLVVHNKSTLADGRINTRDVKALLLTAYSDSRGMLKVFYTRDATAVTLNDQSYTDYGDGHLEYVWNDEPDVTTPISFDTSKAVQTFGCRLQANITYETDPVFGDNTEIGLYPGDYLIFTIHKDGGGATNGGVTFEFAEKI